jgi:hypothetical protein
MLERFSQSVGGAIQVAARTCGPAPAIVAIVLLHACCKPPPPVFTVAPLLACPGQVVDVKWDVTGKATLRTERGPTDWDEGEVPPSGRRRVASAVTTTFRLTLLDVNPAAGPSFGNQQVVIPKLLDERRVLSQCDAATAVCTGSFDLDAMADRLRVRKLSSPLLVQGGRAQATEICVTHDGLPRTCVGPGQMSDVNVPANGTWTLEAALPAGSATPPPALVIRLDFDCE